ncbi:histidine kinase N-terminal 7TM domain-containing protein [Methanolacinia paynteri]|uniref:histidine kinase N-terminal 7TM domain-containing protein n=1 Tax=Methanolacinia paynteri TaxID=230356 RepID=UPI0009FDF035|nr:histidine kinase N-terminal 7TM domain-containing protein [Methanolacinia paynteri]
MFQYHPYLIPVILATALSGFIALYSFRRRRTRGATAFSLLMLLVFIWEFFYMFEISSTNFEYMKLFLRLQYFAIPFIPVVLLYFILEYGGYYRFLNFKYIGLLLIVPLASLILLLTDDYHSLFFNIEYMVAADYIIVRGFEAGPVYSLLWIYCGILYFLSAVISFHIYLSSQGIQKIQSAVLVGALYASLFVEILYQVGVSLYPYLDLTAIIFPISGLCIMIGLFKYSFFDIVPLPKQTIFSSLSEGIIVLDSKKRIIDINSIAQDMLGGAVEVDGSLLFEKDTFLNKYEDQMNSPVCIAFLAKVERDGGEKFYAVSVTPISLNEEDPVYRILVLRDITHEKKYERELEKSRSSLKIANEKISLLNSVTRHDILNNITVLSAYADLIGDQIPEKGKSREYLEKMTKAIEQITQQIRFTADYQNMGVDDPIWQNMRRVVRDAWQSLGSVTSRVKFEVNLPENLEIYADYLLSKVFYNLFENSIRHGERVTKISVSFDTKPDGSGVVIVEDNGVGIPDDVKDRIFSKGFGKNTGLGLFLASEILSITKIEISETGTEGKGARFEMVVHPNGWRVREKKGE